MTIEGKYCRISVGLNKEVKNIINYGKINVLGVETNMNLKMDQTQFRSSKEWIQMKEMDAFRYVYI